MTKIEERPQAEYSEEEIMEEMKSLGLFIDCGLLKGITPEELLANYGDPKAIVRARAKALLSLENKNKIIVGNHLHTLNDAIRYLANFNKNRREHGLTPLTPKRAFEIFSRYDKVTGEYIPEKDE